MIGGIERNVPPPVEPGPGGGTPGSPTPQPSEVGTYGVNPEALHSPELEVVRDEIWWWLGDVVTSLDRLPPTRDTDPWTALRVDKTLMAKIRGEKDKVTKERLWEIRKEVGAVRNVWDAIAVYQDWRGDQTQMGMNMFFAKEVAMLTSPLLGRLFRIPGVNIDAAARVYEANGRKEFVPGSSDLGNDELARIMEEATELPALDKIDLVDEDMNEVDALARKAASIGRLGGNPEWAGAAASLAFWWRQINGDAAWNDKGFKGLPTTDDRVKGYEYYDKIAKDQIAGHPHGPDKHVQQMEPIAKKYGETTVAEKGLHFIAVPFMRFQMYLQQPELMRERYVHDSYIPQTDWSQDTQDRMEEKHTQQTKFRLLGYRPGQQALDETADTFYAGWWREGIPYGMLPWNTVELNAWRRWLLMEGFFVFRKDRGIYDMTMMSKYPYELVGSMDFWRDYIKANNISQHAQNLVAVDKYDSSFQEFFRQNDGVKFIDLENTVKFEGKDRVTALKQDMTDMLVESVIWLNRESLAEVTWEDRYRTAIKEALRQAREKGETDLKEQILYGVKTLPGVVPASQLYGKLLDMLATQVDKGR